MITVRLDSLEATEGWSASDATQRFRSAFPLHASAGTHHTAVVYFEIEPGGALGTHTDSVEEVVLILDGTVVVELGTERGELSSGSIALVPAMVPHAVRNPGSTVARCVGFFSGARVVTTFADAVMPPGLRTFDTGHLPAG